MAEAKPVQPFSNRSAMHRHPMNRGQFHHDLVQRQVTLFHEPRPHPALERGELTGPAPPPRLGFKALARALQDHHVIHKAR